MEQERRPGSGPLVRIREAAAGDLAEVGRIRIGAYRAGGFLSAESQYASMLRELGADGDGLVLVAVAPGGPGAGAPAATGEATAAGQDASAAGNCERPGQADRIAERIVGTVMLQAGPRTGAHVLGPEEAEIRALAVRPEAQGSGIGGLLLREVIGAARAAAVRHLILCTEPEMAAARRLYERAGFVRLPERDWSPSTHTSLLVYGLRLA